MYVEYRLIYIITTLRVIIRVRIFLYMKSLSRYNFDDSFVPLQLFHEIASQLVRFAPTERI